MISRKAHKILAKIQKLKEGGASFHTPLSLLDILRALEHDRIEREGIFDILKEISLSHQNNEIRYLATKLLYKNFPGESIYLILRLLLKDSNYNFRVFNLSNQKRYNFNDIINWGIEDRYNRDLMIKNIINSDLLQFALSWKDYQNEFDILYDVNLNCFLLTVKATNETAYMCRRLTDPFQEIPTLSIENLSEMAHLNTIQTIIGLYEDLSSVKKNELKIARLSLEESSGLPNLKIFSNTCELIIYIEFKFKLTSFRKQALNNII